MTKQSILESIHKTLDAGSITPSTQRNYRAAAHRLLLRVPVEAWSSEGALRLYRQALPDSQRPLFGTVYTRLYQRFHGVELTMVHPNIVLRFPTMLPVFAEPIADLTMSVSFARLSAARWRDVTMVDGVTYLDGAPLTDRDVAALEDVLVYVHGTGTPLDAILDAPVIPFARDTPWLKMPEEEMRWCANIAMGEGDEVDGVMASVLQAIRKAGAPLEYAGERLTDFEMIFDSAKARNRVRVFELAKEAVDLLSKGDRVGFDEIVETMIVKVVREEILEPRHRLRWNRNPTSADRRAAEPRLASVVPLSPASVVAYEPSPVIDPESMSLRQTMKSMNKKLAAVIKGASDV